MQDMKMRKGTISRNRFNKLLLEIGGLAEDIKGLNFLANVFTYLVKPDYLTTPKFIEDLKKKGWLDEDGNFDKDVKVFVTSMFHESGPMFQRVDPYPVIELEGGFPIPRQDALEIFQILTQLAKLNPELVKRLKNDADIYTDITNLFRGDKKSQLSDEDNEKLATLGLTLESSFVDPVVYQFVKSNVKITTKGAVTIIRPK